jgi:hypothetical protein
MPKDTGENKNGNWQLPWWAYHLKPKNTWRRMSVYIKHNPQPPQGIRQWWSRAMGMARISNWWFQISLHYHSLPSMPKALKQQQNDDCVASAVPRPSSKRNPKPRSTTMLLLRFGPVPHEDLQRQFQLYSWNGC